MKEPVDHILRPRLPWRPVNTAPITECGYDAAKVKTLTREEFKKRLADFGQQRTAVLTCMTCADAARRWGTWDDDPRLGMQREIEWERGSYYYSHGREDRGRLLKDELLAIARLIDAYPDEFDEMVQTIQQRQEWLAKKAAFKPKKEARP